MNPAVRQATELARFPLIQRSWGRCRIQGLRSSAPANHELLTEAELKQRKERSQTLLHLAVGEMNIVRRAIDGADGVVLLAGPDGTILDSCGDSTFVRKAQRVSLLPGGVWSEECEGTNAIGTALMERQFIEISGAEHFLEENQFLTCTAMPVMSPQGEVAGILDISGDVRKPPSHCAMLVRLAAASIEHEWVSRFSAYDVLVAFHAHPGMLGSSQEGLLAFSDGVLISASPAGLRLLGLDSAALGQVRWENIFHGECGLGRMGLRTHIHSGILYGNIQKPQTASVAVAAEIKNENPDVALRDDGVWDSDTMQMLAKAKRAFEASIPVLVQGETGTGKEVFARALHRLSSRASAPLVPVNCAAIPEGLLEAELFGYEDGAFTGACKKGSSGYIRRADGGTLFLDEIGDMPLALQARLLRVLQDGEVTPLGSSRAVRVDFRLVAATHQNLQEAVTAGRFRADLYYRLRCMVLVLPPLRERRDIAGILDALMTSCGARERGIRLTSSARETLLHHGWPGNLREMVNLLRTLIALAEDEERIDVNSLPPDMPVMGQPAQSTRLADLEDEFLRRTIAEHNGNISAAARQLGLHRSTLYRRLAEFSSQN